MDQNRARNHTQAKASSKHETRRAACGSLEVKLDCTPWLLIVVYKISNDRLARVLSTYGVVKDIQEERWNEAYEFADVSNGIRIVKIELKYPIPSQLMLNDCRILLSYEGQSKSCFYCKETTHLQIDCPNRKARPALSRKQTYSSALADSDGSSTLSNTTDAEVSVLSPEYPTVLESITHTPHKQQHDFQNTSLLADSIADTSLPCSTEEAIGTLCSDNLEKGEHVQTLQETVDQAAADESPVGMKQIAELSVQGDDFTRQIWHMYATFEEFLDTHTSFGKAGKAGGGEDGRSGSGDGGPAQRNEVGGGGGPRTGGTRRRRSRPTAARRVIGGSALELTVLPRDMAASTPTAGAAVEFDFDTGTKMGNSKDDMSLVYRRPQHHRCRYRRSRRRLDIANPLLETISAIQDACESDDHDYGDAGSQYYGVREHRLPGSRFCSDADKDSIGYAGSNSIDSGYKSSCPTPEPSDGMLYGNEASSKRGSIASQGSQQSQKPRIPMGTKVMNRHSHPQYAGRDLDHLMYLRQSILSAMQRYEQQAAASSPSPVFRPRSSSASSPGYRSASPGSGPGSGSSPLPQRRPHMASCPSSRTHSPCYSSASNGSGKSSPGHNRSGSCTSRMGLATAEEDIDSLLYGRADEMPCSYVTMIEDKYRRSSVARVKKLRDKSRGGLVATESSSSSDSSCPSPTQSPQSGRFSEVAKCMLEIIEDLQNQTQLPVASTGTPVSPPAPAPNPPLADGSRGSGDGGLASGSDYHVYEEIMYELTTRPRVEPGPPPLPARPEAIFRSSSTTKKPTAFPGAPPQPHRPKQRSNLYSLFREPSARRDISQSLEQEFRGTGPGASSSTARELPRLRRPTGLRAPSHPHTQAFPHNLPRPDNDKHHPEEEYGFRVPN
ncbi:uncharacterized protein [Anabrus simplex]|uniref:uncharacterized protein n=1 Tax=Anabrus simplex TaxID=316456 RepID=UPI0035A294AC